MKKFTFAKIASLVFVCAMLFCALAVTTLAADEPTVEIVSNNVYYGEKYQLMFAVNAPEGATVNATVNGTAVDVELFSTNPTDDEGNVVADYAYILADGVAAQAIDAVVTFTVTANGETAATQYSVLQYIYERTHVSENKAEGTELAMFEALVAYADAANTHFKGATVSFNDYVYVTAEGVTVNGVNPTGMYKAGDKPFANVELALDFDEANQVLRWYLDGELSTLDAIKAVEIADKAVAVEAVVLDKCHDGHTWVDPTCQADGYCEVCNAAGEPAVDCKDEDGDYKCDFGCGNNVLPADGTVLTIEQAIEIGNLFTKDTYTETKYYVTGRIKSVYNTTYGNMYLVDENGNEITVYGTFSADGETKYGSMTEKPADGDIVTVYGVIGYYTSAQFKNAWITEYTVHEHEYSDATCQAGPTCAYCGATNGDKIDHNFVDGYCTMCQMKEPSDDQEIITVSKTHKEIASIAGVTAGQNTGKITGKNIALDENVTLVCAKGTSTSDPCIYSESIRMYQGGATMTFTSSNGAALKTIVITLATKSGGQGPITVTGGTASALTNNTYTITVDDGVTTVTVKTAGTSSSTRLYVAGIEVTYAK